MGYRSYWSYYEPSRPIEVKGGIKAQSRSGDFGESWWAQRWIDVLESFHIGPRLGRGKAYARKGQVLSITVEEGLITAEVQGSRPKPYKVEIKVKTLAQAAKKKLLKEIGESILFAVKLHSGEMPKELEEIFMSSGLPLFPQKYSEMKTDCSCPDWSDPCKHIAAVCYLLAEEFDRDPFLIVKLRGLTCEELISATGPAEKSSAPSEKPVFEIGEPKQEDRLIPLSGDSQSFWGISGTGEAFALDHELPSANARTVRRLGKFPFWRGSENLQDVMDSVYRAATASAMEMLAGAADEEGSSELRPSVKRGQKTVAKENRSNCSGDAPANSSSLPAVTGAARAGIQQVTESERPAGIAPHKATRKTEILNKTRLGKPGKSTGATEETQMAETVKRGPGKQEIARAAEHVKRGPGRPKKQEAAQMAEHAKRGPGRPKRQEAAQIAEHAKRGPGRPKRQEAAQMAEHAKRGPGRPKRQEVPQIAEPVKRGPGRPKRQEAAQMAEPAKRGPGRPKSRP